VIVGMPVMIYNFLLIILVSVIFGFSQIDFPKTLSIFFLATMGEGASHQLNLALHEIV